MIDSTFVGVNYGYYHIKQSYEKRSQQAYTIVQEFVENGGKLVESGHDYYHDKMRENLGLNEFDASSKEYWDKAAEAFTRISNLYFNKAPDVKLIQNSLFQRQLEGTLSEFEDKMLGEALSQTIYSIGVDLDKEKEILLKTTADVGEFVKKWNAILADEKAKFDNEVTAKEIPKEQMQAFLEKQNKNINLNNSNNSQSDETNKTTFTPIQAESKNETYKAIDTNELLKKLLEESFDEKDFLKMIFGIKDENLNLKSLDLNSNEFLNSNDLISILSKISLNTFNVLNKSVDVKV
ncbi:hypothetical protein DMB95_05560 [Campylobacter sp. MIT 12-8780]|uniref:hypothetical protein n=1 Tax=unclassified Campylobacter TaxID=2593542 RepID=UPI00115DBFE9|nr:MULTISPECIES: hypothetical protein [unclassified Campylobacter]NDJ27567.1 hypothetical protein [Campylobacter sp. MIT 19-121]TQR41319.1 hypothetical protein DMB95_05560 [Campylobacter sp. MIT 12-8780]